MNLIVFLIRAFAGFTFMIFTGASADTAVSQEDPKWHPNPAATMCSVLLTILYYGPLLAELVKRRGVVIRMPTASSFTVRRLLIFCRWYLAYMLSIVTECYFLELHFVCGILSLITVAAMMPPLDRLIFAPRSVMAGRLKGDPTLLKVFPNLGVFIAIIAIGFYAEENYTATIDTFLISIGLLLVVPTVLFAKGGWKALSLKPAPTAAPTPHPGVTPQSPGVSAKGPGVPAQGPGVPAQRPGAIYPNRPAPQGPPARPGAKRKYYSAKAWYWHWPLPKEAQGNYLDEWTFNLLIRNFGISWLDSKDYHRRLGRHRNPAEFIREIIAEAENYIQSIRSRQELWTRNKTFSMPVGSGRSVPEEVSKVWLADKRLRSLYRATRRFIETPNKQSIMSWRAIAPNIAEYRAMINVVKHLRHSLSRLPGQAPAARSHHATRAATSQQPTPGAVLLAAAATPTYSPATASAPSAEQRYFEIIDYLIELGKNFENYPDLSKNHFDEQWYRDYFLPGLNTRNPDYSAKGEVFNRRGKTDILVFDRKGNNLLIAECKLWKGETYLREGIDQLLHRYVNWRDEKTAIIIFNRDVKNFTGVIETATKTLSSHPLCHQEGRQRTDCSWSYLFHHPNDEARVIRLELILLNFV